MRHAISLYNLGSNMEKIKVPLKDESSLAYKHFSNEGDIQVWHLLPIEYKHNVIGVIAV